jgi:pentafunctional AROM polypeptide
MLPVKAAPGQLSFKEIQTALNLLGLLPPRQFFLLGNPIKHSMSPTLHNTGFELLGLPHHYQIFETETVNDEIKALLVAPNFGGASVTIPYKLEIIPLLDELTPAAKTMGAVNTIVPLLTKAGRKLIGDNTDWIGVHQSVISFLPTNPIHAGLVIGAGGTARAAIYALNQLGAKYIYLFNRTKAKALVLAQLFPNVTVNVLDRLTEWPVGLPPPNVIIGTVPSDATTLIEGEDGLYLTPSLYEYKDGPAVVVDMAYKPPETPLLTLAKAASSNWATVSGIEVLLEQGFVQFELWTGRRCPRPEVARRVRERYYDTV